MPVFASDRRYGYLLIATPQTLTAVSSSSRGISARSLVKSVPYPRRCLRSATELLRLDEAAAGR